MRTCLSSLGYPLSAGATSDSPPQPVASPASLGSDRVYGPCFGPADSVSVCTGSYTPAGASRHHPSKRLLGRGDCGLEFAGWHPACPRHWPFDHARIRFHRPRRTPRRTCWDLTWYQCAGARDRSGCAAYPAGRLVNSVNPMAPAFSTTAWSGKHGAGTGTFHGAGDRRARGHIPGGDPSPKFRSVWDSGQRDGSAFASGSGLWAGFGRGGPDDEVF